MNVLETAKFSPEELAENFPNAPLREASYEIRFPPRLRITQEIWRIQEQLGDEYPNFGTENVVGIGANLMTTHVFAAADNSRQIKVSQQNLAIIMTVYPGFAAFLRDVIGKTHKFCEMFSIEGLIRVGLRYTNNVLLPGGNRLQLGEYVNPLLDLSRISLRETNQFACEVRSVLADHSVTVRTALFSDPAAVYVLDIDTYVERSCKPSELEGLLSKFHGCAKMTFLDHIKPSLKAVFRGKTS